MPIQNFDYQVKWGDFNQLSARPAGEKEDAQIHPEMSFSNFKLTRDGNAVKIKDVDLKIYLVSSDCWVVTKEKSDELLKHEQGHYDILAISARELYNNLLAISATSTNDLQTKVTAEQEKLAKKVKIVDDHYDDKTEHSRNKAEQKSWNLRIENAKKSKTGKLDDVEP